MELSLPGKFRKLIDQRARMGKYATRENVVMAALTALDQNERFGNFALGELNRLRRRVGVSKDPSTQRQAARQM